jgi:hypothetical protein
MHASLTTTLGPADDDQLELAVMVGETMLGWLRDLEGFEGLLMLSDEDRGTTHVITFWESAEVAERSRISRLQLRDRITETVSVEVQETRPYTVSFADLGGFATLPPR